MVTMNRAFGACVAAVALLVVSCSSSAGKRSTPTTRSASTTIVATPLGGSSELGATGVATKLGACPARLQSMKALNRAVRHRDKELVPFAALKVRLCAYAWNGNTVASQLRLSGSGLLTPAATATFEDKTNALPKYTSTPGCDAPAGGSVAPGGILLTFAGDSEEVSVYACAGGGVAENGVYTAQESTKWLTELKGYMTGVDPRLGTTGPQG